MLELGNLHVVGQQSYSYRAGTGWQLRRYTEYSAYVAPHCIPSASSALTNAPQSVNSRFHNATGRLSRAAAGSLELSASDCSAFSHVVVSTGHSQHEGPRNRPARKRIHAQMTA